MIASGFSWFHLMDAIGHDTLLAGLGIHHSTYLIVTAWSVVALLIVAAGVARIGLERARARQGLERYFPDDRLTPRTLAEVYVTGMYGMMRDVVGDRDAKSFLPLVGGLFLYILTCNVFGVLPGLLPPTDDINNNVGMGITVFLVFNYVGLSRDPVGYVKHLFGPVWWLAPLLFVVEVLGLMIRPVTLSLRLTANLFGDHTVFGIMSSLVPWFIPVPALFLAFGLFVSFIQAFVFSLLSTIYIGLSKPHDEEHAAH
jgi:F-type H+-transporting ATPase subunit a